jgi:hypothetical protein
MMFETRFIREMFEMVEENGDKPFWAIFLEKVEPWLRHGIGSGASEYELYFNYVCKFHSDEIEVRELSWENVRQLDFNMNLHYISHHHFMRE